MTLPPKLTPKGELRRTALLDGVVRVLEREGPSGVTHRAVATEAGVPLAAATYYFASIDDLLITALTRATEQQAAMFVHLGKLDIPSLAQQLHEFAHGSRQLAIAQYELLLLAMRRDSLRDAADLWYRTLETAIESQENAPDPARARIAAFAIDGLLLRMLWRNEPATVAEVEAALRDILG